MCQSFVEMSVRSELFLTTVQYVVPVDSDGQLTKNFKINFYFITVFL